MQSYPEVISSIDIPLHEVAVSFWCKRIEAMALSNATPLVVCLLLVVLVMAMVGVKYISELSGFVFRVHDSYHGLLKL